MNNLDLNLREETKSRVYHPLYKFNYHQAYQYYLKAWMFVRSFEHNFYGDEAKKLFIQCERQLETQAEELGVSEIKTGLISENALITKIREALHGKEHTKKKEALATEHPITKRSVAKFLLWGETQYSFEEYWAIWNNHLVTVITTNHENHSILQPLQQEFTFGECWKDLYERAGIKLYENPDFRNPATKQKWVDWLNERERNTN